MTVAGWKFDLLRCRSIAKSCFLLSRRDVLLTIVLTGVLYFLAIAYRLPCWSQETAALIAQKGIARVLEENKSVIFFDQPRRQKRYP